MKNKLQKLLVLIISLAAHQSAIAHGTGGGGSYEFDKNNPAVDRQAEKLATEKKQDQDNWADFMKAIDSPKSETVDEVEPGEMANEHDH